MPPATLEEQVQSALALLPETGEVDVDVFKTSLYGANPDGGKAALTSILTRKLCNRRLEVKDGKATVYISRKAQS